MIPGQIEAFYHVSHSSLVPLSLKLTCAIISSEVTISIACLLLLALIGGYYYRKRMNHKLVHARTQLARITTMSTIANTSPLGSSPSANGPGEAGIELADFGSRNNGQSSSSLLCCFSL